MTHSRIVLIAHTPLASAIKACGVHILGEQAADVIAVDVLPDQDVLSWRPTVLELLQAAEGPVLLLTDVYGATPFNIARDWADWCARQRVPACVLSGLNVPMLLRAITYRDGSLEQCAEKAQAGGVQGITLSTPAVFS